jgi:hypothetical protein
VCNSDTAKPEQPAVVRSCLGWSRIARPAEPRIQPPHPPAHCVDPPRADRVCVRSAPRLAGPTSAGVSYLCARHIITLFGRRFWLQCTYLPWKCAEHVQVRDAQLDPIQLTGFPSRHIATFMAVFGFLGYRRNGSSNTRWLPVALVALLSRAHELRPDPCWSPPSERRARGLLTRRFVVSHGRSAVHVVRLRPHLQPQSNERNRAKFVWPIFTASGAWLTRASPSGPTHDGSSKRHCTCSRARLRQNAPPTQLTARSMPASLGRASQRCAPRNSSTSGSASRASQSECWAIAFLRTEAFSRNWEVAVAS